jgi:putative sigma-54 modulation protein
MKYIISGRNIVITDGLKDAVIEKIGKLERYFSEDTEAQITLSVEKDRQKIEVTIPVKGSTIRAEQTSTDMYVSIDLVEETIERQLKKYKTRLTEKSQTASFTEQYMEEDFDDNTEIKIVKTKRFGIKPMSAEEACLQMELLGHSFYVFCNDQTDEVNVVYKRKDGAFGLIEPTFE